MRRRGDNPDAKLRVLMSGHLPPPMGGVAAFYQTLLNSSLSQRVDLSFVITSSQRRTLAASGRATASNLISAISDCARFTKACWRHRPEVTHIATAFGLSFVKHSLCVLIARLLGSRVLLHPHCSFKTLYAERGSRWKWYVRRVISVTQGVIGLSSEWEQLHDVVPGCRVYALPNAIDLQPFRAIAQERLGRTQMRRPVHVFYIGCLGSAKGTFDLIRAAANMNGDAVFDLVGEELRPGERGQLEQFIRVMHVADDVFLHGPAFGKEKIEFFRQADIMVYPSYDEGMPMAIEEAMASGLPVVASRVGGLPDLVQDGVNGLLVDAGNPDQIADAISRIANDDAMRLSMQRQAYQEACERFDVEQLVSSLVKIYEVVAAGNVWTAPAAP